MNNNPFASAFSSIVQNKNKSGKSYGGNLQNQPQNGGTWQNQRAQPSSSGYVPRPIHNRPNVWQAASMQAVGQPYVAYPQQIASYPTYQHPPPNYLPQAFTQQQQQYPVQQPQLGHAYPGYHVQPALPSYGAAQPPLPPPRPPSYHQHNAYSAYQPPPSSSITHCSACNKDLPNQAAYKAHCETHVPCDHPGCTFTASRKVISAHYQSTHGEYSGSGYKEIDVEGQSFRVLCGTSPEEVAQWREERRNKFPTKAQIQVKQTNKEQLEIAGGVDMTKESGKKRANQQQQQRRGNNRQEKNNKRNKRDRDYYQPQPASADKVEDNDDVATQSLNLASSSSNNKPHASNNNKDKDSNNSRSNNNSNKLKKPDISGNLLGRLLAEDVAQSENLLLQSIRFLRQLYCTPPTQSEGGQQEMEVIQDVVKQADIKLIEEVVVNDNAGNLLLQFYGSDDDEEDGECQ